MTAAVFYIYHIYCISKTGQNNFNKLYISLSYTWFGPMNGKYSNIYIALKVFL